MAYIQYRKTKKGILVARIQVSGKDPETGEFKVYPKNIQNDEGLTEAKFKKKITILAAEFENEVANVYKDQIWDIVIQPLLCRFTLISYQTRKKK